MLTEENYELTINSYLENDWKPLLEFFNRLQDQRITSKLVIGKPDKNGVTPFPYYEVNSLISEFQEIVYNIPVMISFDWTSWDEGREIIRDINFDFDKIDIPTKCKLITAFVRSDRFCDGALIMAFESGQIPDILKSIKKQLGYV